MHDIVIRGGRIVDGTGRPPARGDLAIDAGIVTAVGRVAAAGRQEIDAADHLVTPGFVDIHTHLDAQIGWDPFLTPVSWHGVTTALLGNCGVTFAPCRPSDRELLAGMMHDPDFCARLVDAAQRQPGKAAPPGQVFWMGTGETPEYSAGPERSLEAMAEAAGEHWAETFLRLSRESRGKGLFTFRMFNQHLGTLRDLLASPRLLPILGDAGAHVSQIMDAGWASFVLSYWVREAGLFPLEEAVRRMTSAPARIIGLADRGTLAPGMRADVNVFDPERVAERQPEMVHDFPGGAPRLIQRSHGYRATIVNGRLSVVDGEHTGVRAGAVLRHPRRAAA